MEESLIQSEANATEAAANRLAEGRGISRADPRDEYLRQYLSEEDYARHADPNTSNADRAALDDLANKNGATAGDLAIQIAQATNNAADLNLKAGSYIEYMRF